MIKLQAIGNIGRDAKVTEVNGRRAINFSICHNHKVKDKSGVQVEKCVWVSCTYWREGNQNTEIAKYLTKGTKIYVEGLPDVEIYKDVQGRPACALNLRVDRIELLGPKAENQEAHEQRPPEPADQNDLEMSNHSQDSAVRDPDDLPF